MNIEIQYKFNIYYLIQISKPKSWIDIVSTEQINSEN